jgi:hypothetical protein
MKYEDAKARLASALATKKKADDEAAALAEAEQVIAEHEANEAEKARQAAEDKLRKEYASQLDAYNAHRDAALDLLAEYASEANKGMALWSSVHELHRQIGLLLPGGSNDPSMPELPMSASQVIAAERGLDSNRFAGLNLS